MAALLAAVSGCIPYPVQHTLVPGVSGTLIRERAPVADARVFLSRAPERQACRTRVVAETRTGTDGAFLIPEKRRTRLDLFIPMAIVEAPFLWWQVCFAVDSDTLRGPTYFSRGGPVSVVLDCKVTPDAEGGVRCNDHR